MAQELRRATVNATGCGFDSRPCAFKFRHSTCNASRIKRRVRNRSVLMVMECVNIRFPGSLPALLSEGCCVIQKKKIDIEHYDTWP